MIVLLRRGRQGSVPDELTALGEVKVFRVPAAPKERRHGVDWAQARLQALRELVADAELLTCADAAALPFAWRAAEAFPDVPVISEPEVAARVVTLLRERNRAVTTQTVRALLDAERPIPPRRPAYLTDRASRPPMVVSLVNNTVTGDSRVLKVARSLARFGFDSVVVGRAPRSQPGGDYVLFDHAVVLRPWVGLELLTGQLAAPPAGPLVRLFGYRSEVDEVSATHRLQLRGKSPGRFDLRHRIARFRSGITRQNREAFATLGPRTRAHRLHATLVRRGVGAPQAAYPAIADFKEAMAPIAAGLWPDAIHVHDPVMLETAVAAREQLHRLGHDVRIVYDAHEWTPSLERDHALHIAALTRSEELHIPSVDAVMTASEQISERVQERFSLPERPQAVTNAPIDRLDPAYRDLRAELRLDRSTPLAVYNGGIMPARGLDDAVQALIHLPGVHLALLSRTGPAWRALQRFAREIGVADRVHRVDYVPVDDVASYIRNADVGLIPFRPYLNAELGIPTKFREYLLAGLPIVASDLGLTAAAVRETGVGELYPTQSPPELAAAVRRVLSDPDRYRRAITPELRRANTWGTQESVLRRVYAGVLGEPEPVPPRSVDVLIGATNSAGQAGAWAGALREAGLTARSLELRSPDNPFGHAADAVLFRDSVDTLERRVQLMLREVLAAKSVIMESIRWLAAPEPGVVPARRVGFREAQALADSGRRVGLIFHGSDIRRPDVHARTHAWSPFRETRADPAMRELQERTSYTHEHLAHWQGPVMVSTPDLVGQTAGAAWVPVVIDLDVFAPAPRPQRPVPVVVHLPSRSALKGSARIDPVLQELAGQGVIRYRRYADVPHAAVPALLAEADVVVDQLGMGILGVGALEAMAMGIPLVTDPGPEALEAYGEEVPLVAVTPDSLEDAIVSLAGDEDRRAALAAAGPDFVRRHHDGRRSAAAMIAAMGLTPS